MPLAPDCLDRRTANTTAGQRPTRLMREPWVHRYNGEGLAGLRDRPRSGRKPRLTPRQTAELEAVVARGPDPERDGIVRWRRVDLQALIEARFAVELHERSVGKLLRRLGFTRLSVRPKHPSSDRGAQEAFKKASPSW
jgi:transposase